MTSNLNISISCFACHLGIWWRHAVEMLFALLVLNVHRWSPLTKWQGLGTLQFKFLIKLLGKQQSCWIKFNMKCDVWYQYKILRSPKLQDWGCKNLYYLKFESLSRFETSGKLYTPVVWLLGIWRDPILIICQWNMIWVLFHTDLFPTRLEPWSLCVIKVCLRLRIDDKWKDRNWCLIIANVDHFVRTIGWQTSILLQAYFLTKCTVGIRKNILSCKN